jgi:hypothetical protein
MLEKSTSHTIQLTRSQRCHRYFYPQYFCHQFFCHRFFCHRYLLMLFGLACGLAFGQISAEVDRTTLTTNDTVQLTVTVTGSGSTRPPEMASLTDFDVLRSNISTNISITNGNMQSQVIYQYLLQPLRAGTLTIPAVSVSLQGQTYNTDPISLAVSENTDSPTTSNQTDPAFFVEAEVDNPQPFVGEQVLYTFRFFHAERVVGGVDYNAPEFAGFWEGVRPEQRQYQLSRSGRRYNITELQTPIFPTRAGDLAIDPAVLNMAANFMASPIELTTDAITVSAQPLPEPAPADFNGAVGQFAISAFSGSATAVQGEPLELEVFVSGSSNLDTLPEPTQPLLDDWRVQLEDIETNTLFQDGLVSGTKVFRYALIPEITGQLDIPPFRYSYFDPEALTYRQIESEPLRVAVAPNPQAQAPQTSAATSEPASEPPAGQTPTGLPLAAVRVAPSQLGQPNTGWTFWALWAVAPLGCAVAWGYQQRRRYLYSDATRIGFMRAYADALARIKMLAPPSSDPSTSSEDSRDRTIYQVLMGYLEAKLATPLAGQPKEALQTILPRYGVSHELTQRVHDYLGQLDEMRYAARPVGDTLQEGKTLLEQLEKELRWHG